MNLTKITTKKCLYGHKHENKEKKWCDRIIITKTQKGYDQRLCRQELKETYQ